MAGNATQALKDYAIMTGTFWCASQSLSRTAPDLSTLFDVGLQGQQLILAARPQVCAGHVRQVVGSDSVATVAKITSSSLFVVVAVCSVALCKSTQGLLFLFPRQRCLPRFQYKIPLVLY